MTFLFRCSLALLLSLTLVACSDDSDGDGGSNNADNNAANNAGNNATNNSSNNADNNADNNGANNSSNNAANNAANNSSNNAANNNSIDPVETCAEIESTDCFFNTDCEEGNRCQDVGGEDIVACCVPGERGTGALGDACEDENGCASGICLEGFCSDDCMDDESCPDSLPCCVAGVGLCLPVSESTCGG